MEDVEGADAGGKDTGKALVGSVEVVDSRRRPRRNTTAVLAALQAAATSPQTRVSQDDVDEDVRRVQAWKGLVAKSVEKIKSDERTWDRYLRDQPLAARTKYPSVKKVVAFAAWTTRTRQRACLAQRPGAGPTRTGLGQHNTRVMLTQLSDHVWPRRYPAFDKLQKNKRLAYWADILAQAGSLHKVALGGGEGSVSSERAAQLTAQTGPVTERKNFYRTEVHQLQVGKEGRWRRDGL